MESHEDLVAGTSPVPDARRGGDDLLGLFYTGGTTGFPKGVMLSHANFLTAVLGMAVGGIGAGVCLHVAPMSHLADLAMWGQLIQGGTHVIVPSFDPIVVMAAVESARVTDARLIPTMIQLLVDHPALDAHDLSSLRRVYYGGSPISQGVLDRAMKALPTVELAQAYGMTELAPLATMLRAEDHAGPRLRSAGRAGVICEVRIVDPDDHEVPHGTVGEVVVRGGNVMQGYWNKPEETAAALRGGWMHTGDAGYLDDDGFLFLVDRVKDMIVTGGENVYSAEVENALSSHPAVAACAVIGVPDPDWGERVHAVIVPVPGAAPTAGGLRDHCKTSIAGYKAPRSVELVDSLPLSGAGKVLKRDLRAKHWGATDRQVH
jgi:acyl-CoA synthetase (AMP-forming)/AMP-acid ligase II